MSEITLILGRPPAEPLSTNEERSLNRWKARERLVPWKLIAWVTARQANLAAAVEASPCNVQVIIPFDCERRRDPSNYVGTVVKAVIDGLVQAKVWPDDTPEYVTVIEPRLIVDTTGRGEAAVILQARVPETSDGPDAARTARGPADTTGG